MAAQGGDDDDWEDFTSGSEAGLTPGRFGAIWASVQKNFFYH